MGFFRFHSAFRGNSGEMKQKVAQRRPNMWDKMQAVARIFRVTGTVSASPLIVFLLNCRQGNPK